ncbi:MAG: type IV pilus assembly protein PilQ, partial [Lentimonas sp.]
ADRGSKVPILGDLPGIGRFFSSESDEIYQRNLIIFITAKTLNPDGSTYRDIIDPRVLNRMGVTPADVPGYQLSEEDRATLTDLENFRAQTKRTEAMAKSRNELKAIEQARKQAAKDAGKLASEAAAAADEVSAK